jgi:hypothetical protein
VLGDTDPEPDIELSLDGSTLIPLEDAFYALKYTRTDSPLMCRDFSTLTLPRELLGFYQLLFPETSSVYYKHFLLYTYLRLVAGTSFRDRILKYDTRITYDLAEIQDYFRFYRNSNPYASDQNFALCLLGNLKPDDGLNYYLNNFVLRQVGDTSSLLLFSTTQGLYYSESAAPSKNSEGMAVQLSYNPSTGASNIARIGDTGLSFFIAGPFNDPDLGLLTQAERSWSFTAETPFIFDFEKKLAELEKHPQILSSMLAYSSEKCEIDYENLWRMHYNSVYRFVGLLMAYVERVQQVWLQQTSQ